MTPWLLALHVLGIVLWIGGLLAATGVLAQSAAADAAIRAAVAQPARKLMRLLADPGAALAIVAGGWLLSADAMGYFAQPWFQTKLVVVVGLIGLHGATAVRAKRAATGGEITTRQVWGVFLAVLAAAIVRRDLPVVMHVRRVRGRHFHQPGRGAADR